MCRVQSIKFSTSTATVGCINQNGIMELSRLAKFATCSVRERHWSVPWLKGLQVLGREGVNISISKSSFWRNSYSTSLTEKKLQTIKFARQYRISLQQPINWIILDIYHVFISTEQMFSLLCQLTRCIIHHISMPCRSRVHRDGGLKANHSLAFGITIWKKVTFTGKSNLWCHHVWWTSTKTSLYGYIYNNKGLIAFFQIWTPWFFCLVKTILF